MGLLHREEPVETTVPCPRCGAVEWTVRRPRLGGAFALRCRACGFEEGGFPDGGPSARALAEEEEGVGPPLDLGAPDFPVYAPEGPHEAGGSTARTARGADGGFDYEVLAVSRVRPGPPWVQVTTSIDAEHPRARALDALEEALRHDFAAGHDGVALALHRIDVARRLEQAVVHEAALAVDGVAHRCRLAEVEGRWGAALRVGDVDVTVACDGATPDAVALRRL